MRTTITLEDDVAVQIERLRKARDLGLKDIINEALRRGLKDMAAKPKKRAAYQSRVHHGGKLLIPDVKDALDLMDQDYLFKKLK
ncbi:MAG: CopG family transcriptional regulator [Alphaproteobacteria bacterium]